ncbi:ribulose-phosphate 3-epimerase [Enterococcus asini]|uniref:Ribulose-phosphate 3-epimerase n=1 Tax=Enterococcus asini ATCC 700915 TaxID=1158606 RepID=R2RV57_9ENTE|nr:ribulose-phosphate 3-epimerase [Enterococcus asini]EOH84361.1 ribulose-phosphate 3-epimerase [Enterococcus asini ATCC 700915]EOT57076.1 ribulose-phosphate 3-epimerase [Enterococcus asini ATCC 700915]MCD5029960.1 ribulose-phosphate 3-epimerase [Enterococcus asini]MDT2745182.1 ribulose-phosphate 3-epimerase [Enterococcus asini]MDT2764659.1 ribulose-phosphate 3-epimerase [Enterococcus asini]
MKIAPSILSADFANLQRDIELVEENQVDVLHVDIMDGHFVPNITFGPNVVAAIRPFTKLPLDCHLMIEQPERYVEAFANAGADLINVHVEATPHIHRVLQLIKSFGVKAAVTINPGTPVSAIEPVLSLVDMVLVMTVNPGFGGQKFLPECLEKVTALAEIRRSKGYTYEIEVDGGVTDQTIGACRDAGADVFVAGSYIYDAENPAERIQALKDVLEQ